MTNGDRIRQMSNEELAEFLEGNCTYCLNYSTCDNKLKLCDEECEEGIKAYLESEEE